MSLALYPKKNIQKREQVVPRPPPSKLKIVSGFWFPPSEENVEILGVSFCAKCFLFFFLCAQPVGRTSPWDGRGRGRGGIPRWPPVLLFLVDGGYSKICATYGEWVLATAANKGRSLDSIPRTMPSSLTCTRVCPFKYSANIFDLK